MPRDGSPTRERILEAAERLVIDNGFTATSLDQVIAASQSSKGAFFHHFTSKLDLAEQLVERYAAADIAHLETALDRTRSIGDPAARLLGFLHVFEDTADELMAAQSSCLYVAILTERQLVDAGTTGHIRRAVIAWRQEVAALFAAALEERRPGESFDCEALADQVFVTFEGAFILCRTMEDPAHMGRQLRALRRLVEGLLRESAPATAERLPHAGADAS